MPITMYKASEQPTNQIKHVIAIAAGKGGVGKSTVTVNLALALQSLGFNVGILDADIYGPSVRKMLPEEHPLSQQGSRLIPAICYGGIRMMSMAYFRNEKDAAAIRAPIANGIITQFIQNTVWGNLDYLLIDFPPGTGDIQLTLSQHANLLGALMVTTPQEVAVMDVRKAMDLFEKVRIPILGIVENMSYYKDCTTGQKLHLFGKSGGQKLAKSSKVPFLGEIPVDPEISHCGDSGTPLKDCLFVFLELAKNLIQEVEAVRKDPFAIRSVKRLDHHHFQIEWMDNTIGSYNLHSLQKLCSCAKCIDEATGKRRGSAPESQEDVQAKSIDSVGKYGIKITFTSGCSSGIYDYQMLRSLC